MGDELDKLEAGLPVDEVDELTSALRADTAKRAAETIHALLAAMDEDNATRVLRMVEQCSTQARRMIAALGMGGRSIRRRTDEYGMPSDPLDQYESGVGIGGTMQAVPQMIGIGSSSETYGAQALQQFVSTFQAGQQNSNRSRDISFLVDALDKARDAGLDDYAEKIKGELDELLGGTIDSEKEESDAA